MSNRLVRHTKDRSRSKLPASAWLAVLATGAWCALSPARPLSAAQDGAAIRPSAAAETQPKAPTTPIAGPFRQVDKVNGLPIVDHLVPPPKVTDAFAVALATGDAAKAKADLVRQLKTALGAGDEAALRRAAGDDTTRLAMMRHELLRLVGLKTVAELRARPQGADFLARLMASREWLEDFLMTGPFEDQGKNAADLHFLCTIYRYDKRCTVPLYRKLACAWARNQGGGWNDGAVQFALLDGWQAQVRMHQEGRMHASFDRLESWEMMFTTSCGSPGGSDSRSLEAFAYDRHCPQSGYLGACYEIPWVGDNQFGDSCQGDPYYSMWKNHYVRGCPSVKKVWGVCGTLSTFGSNNTRAHGVPGFNVGQPGHCAYMVRTGDTRWDTGNSVTWPTGAGSFYGHSDETIVRLMQAAWDGAARPAQLRTQQHLWQRNFLLAARDLELEPGTLRTYSGGKRNTVEEFAGLKPLAETTTDSTDLLGAVSKLSGWRGASLDSAFTLAAETQLLFTLRSDDGSRVYVDGKRVVDLDGPRAGETKEGRVTLPAGRHTLRLEYFDGGGGASFSFGMKNLAPMPPAVQRATALALAECPLDLNAWRLVAADLRADPAATPAAWEQLGARFTTELKDYPHIALDWLNKEVYPALKGKATPVQKAAWLNTLHATLPRNRLGGFFGEHLNQQADFIGDKDAQLKFFASLLVAYGEAKSDLPNILAWASKRLGADKATAPGYVAELARFLSSPRAGNAGDPLRVLGDMAAVAEDKGDIVSFKAVTGMLPALMQGKDPLGLRQFNRAAADKFPKTRQFPGKLLSADGILMPSSQSDSRLALTHADALGESPIGGLIHTKQEVRPSVTLKLQGLSALSGLVIVNRYEGLGERNLPLKVSVSEDGKHWTEVLSTRENKPAWEVDLSASSPKAQYVRLERADERKEAMNLRAIRAYGKPLY